MLRCCYVTGHGWGGGDINVHVPCLHTWMLRRCCEFLEHLEDLLPQDWCCQMRKKEANPGIDKVVTSFSKIVSLRRKRHFANFPMEFSHKKCIHLKLEKNPLTNAQKINAGWYSIFILSHGRLCAGFLVCTKTDQPKDVTFLRPWFCASCSTPPNPWVYHRSLDSKTMKRGVLSCWTNPAC